MWASDNWSSACYAREAAQVLCGTINRSHTSSTLSQSSRQDRGHSNSPSTTRWAVYHSSPSKHGSYSSHLSAFLSCKVDFCQKMFTLFVYQVTLLHESPKFSLLFDWKTWFNTLLCRYSYRPYGIFEKLGIPGPKPYIYLGTVGRHHKVCTSLLILLFIWVSEWLVMMNAYFLFRFTTRMTSKVLRSMAKCGGESIKLFFLTACRRYKKKATSYTNYQWTVEPLTRLLM